MRIALTISYLGEKYHGWQIQNGEQSGNPTIQLALQQAIQKGFGQACQVVGSGRTDQGVSALGQVAHMDLETTVLPETVAYVINQHLPQDIRVITSQLVDNDFHARYSAKQKTYCYSVYFSNIAIPYYDQFAVQMNGKIDLEKIREAITYLVGTHDFTSFCSASTEVVDKVRTITDCQVEKKDGIVSFRITGNGFLYNMVRIIVGTLLEVGYGKRLPQDIKTILEAKDRTKAGKTMPAKGLILYGVDYNK